MLVANFAHDNPVLNKVLMVVVFLVFAVAIVFHDPLERLLDRINLRVLQALGIADRDDDRPDPADDDR